MSIDTNYDSHDLPPADKLREQLWLFIKFVAVGVVALVLGIAVVLGLVWLFYGSGPDPLMLKCMADGHKDYECVGIIRGHR